MRTERRRERERERETNHIWINKFQEQEETSRREILATKVMRLAALHRLRPFDSLWRCCCCCCSYCCCCWSVANANVFLLLEYFLSRSQIKHYAVNWPCQQQASDNLPGKNRNGTETPTTATIIIINQSIDGHQRGRVAIDYVPTHELIWRRKWRNVSIWFALRSTLRGT